jgi:hypothetical protein
MTITELPRRVRAAARQSGNGWVTRFFEPGYVRPRKLHSRLTPTSLASNWRHDAISLPTLTNPGEANPEAIPNAPLGSLAGGSLASRFHAWWGVSGQRYVCTVFQADLVEPDCGLPEFAEMIVLAVGYDSTGARKLLALCHMNDATDPSTRSRFVEANFEAGATEWHVHLLTDGHRQVYATRDLEARLNGF